MSLEPASRAPNRSIQSLRSQVVSLQNDIADRGKEIAALTPSSSPSAEKLALTQSLGAAIRNAEELRTEAEKRNFLLGVWELKSALAGEAEPPGGARPPGFLQRVKRAVLGADELAEQLGREWRGSFSSNESGTGETTEGRGRGDRPTELEGGDADPCAEEKKRIKELSAEIIDVSAKCDSLKKDNEKIRTEVEDLKKKIVNHERRMPHRNLVKPQLTLRDCERHQSELCKKVLQLRKENGGLKEMTKRYRYWFMDLLPGDVAEKLIADSGASRRRLEELKATLAAKTAQTHALWTGKGLSAGDLTKKKREWKDLESHMKTVTTAARSLMCCEDLRIELYNAKIALQELKDENEALFHALHRIVPYVPPPGANAAKKREIVHLKARLATVRKQQLLTDEKNERVNELLRDKISKVAKSAAKLENQRAEDLESYIDELISQVTDLGPTANPVRFSFLNERIAKMEAPGSSLTAEGRKLIADLRAERVLLMRDGKLRAYAIALQKEAIPPVPGLSDVHFQQEWEALFSAVHSWCSEYYRFSPESIPVSYDELVRSANPLGFYLREVLAHRDYVERLLPNVARPNVATGIVFRILVDEIFEPLRFMLHLRFQEPKEKWMIKPQYKAAFESEDMADGATAPRFQARESFLQRVEKRALEPYQHPEEWEFEGPPKKRVRKDYFNFFKTFEDSEERSKGRDNDDDIALNMARAKLITSIFSLKNNPISRHASDLRSNVCTLITSTLRPLSAITHPGTPSQAASSVTPRGGPIFNPSIAARDPYPSTTYAADPRAHASKLKKLVEKAFGLAVQMASHPALIHPLPTDLMSMKAFDSTCMTIANHPGGGTTASSSSSSSRAAGVDNKYSAVAKHMVDTGKAGKVGCYFRPVCEVVPALVRRGQAVRGGYSWAEKVVVAKAKVYVGGPDEVGQSLRFTVHEFPYDLENL